MNLSWTHRFSRQLIMKAGCSLTHWMLSKLKMSEKLNTTLDLFTIFKAYNRVSLFISQGWQSSLCCSLTINKKKIKMIPKYFQAKSGGICSKQKWTPARPCFVFRWCIFVLKLLTSIILHIILWNVFVLVWHVEGNRISQNILVFLRC